MHNYTGILCFRINKIAFLLKPLNFADSQDFNHTLISYIVILDNYRNGDIQPKSLTEPAAGIFIIIII